MADDNTAERAGDDAAKTGWQGEQGRDLATYRLFSLGKALVQHTGQQEDIAEQIGRHSDLLVHLTDEGFTGLVPQAIIAPSSDEHLFFGRIQDKRDEYLVYCRAAEFETAFQYVMEEADHELASAQIHYFRGDARRAEAWAHELMRLVEHGDFRRAGGSADRDMPADRQAHHGKLGFNGSAPKNRHRYKRSSVFCAGKILFGDEVIDCDVLNISAGGAQVRVIGDEEPPDAFALRIEGFGEFDSEVVRRAGNKYGLAFHDAPDVGERVVEDIIEHPEKTNEIRKYPRRLVLLSGAVYVDNRAVDCRVLDISVGGARVRTERAFNHDRRFPLVIHRFGEFPVEVAWEEETDLGIAFVDDPDEIQRIIGHILPKKSAASARR